MGGKNNWQKVAQMNAKEHYKAYKVGKNWTFTSIASIAVGFGLFWGANVTGYAATAVASDSTTTVTNTPDTSKVAAQGTKPDSDGAVVSKTNAQGAASTNSESTVATTNEQAVTPETNAADGTTNTDKLKGDSSQLQDAVNDAKEAGVDLTKNDPKTVTTTPEGLADTEADVKSDYEAQIQQLKDALAKQKLNNEAYAALKAAFDNNEVTIKSTVPDWSDAELIKLLAGEGNAADVTGTTSVTDAEKLAASDEAKASVLIRLQDGYTVTKADGTPVGSMDLTPGAHPSWTYHNAFVNSETGNMIDVVETVTGYKLAKGTTSARIVPTTNLIGFQPYNVENVSAKLEYFDAVTGEPITIDAVVGMSDIDGNQGITINNSYQTLLRGSAISKNETTGAYQDTHDNNFGDTEAKGQVWVLQKGVSETDYTFYVGLNADGTVNNTQPLQYIGGAAFSVKVPTAPTRKVETASYTKTTIEVPTTYTIHYEGAGDNTPGDSTTRITWLGSYDADNGYTWTPDQASINIASPSIDGFRADSPQAGWTLSEATTDPANQTMTVAYHPILTVNDNSELTTHFVDGAGNQLAESTTQAGTQGDNFNTKAIEIAGYTPVGQTTVQGTYQGNQMDVTFVYAKEGQVADNNDDSAATLTTHYVDQDGNPIADATTQKGARGSSFETHAIEVDGYTPIGQNTLTGTYQGNQMDMTFVYAKEGQVPDEQSKELASNLTTHYVDQEGNEIAAPTTQTGDRGSDFETNAIEINGYTPVGQNTLTGTYQGNQMDVTFVYAKEGQVADAATSTLIVQYVDESGNPLSAPTQQSGAIGDPFSVTAVNVPGYGLPAQPTVTGTYQGNQMVLTFVYHKNTVPTPPNDTENPGTPETGEIPTPPEAPAPRTIDTPEGGTIVADTDEPSSSDSEQAKVPSGTAKIQQSVTPDTSENAQGVAISKASSQPVKTAKAQTGTVSANQLPQTSEEASNVWAVVGMGMLSLFSLFSLADKRRKGHNE